MKYRTGENGDSKELNYKKEYKETIDKKYTA